MGKTSEAQKRVTQVYRARNRKRVVFNLPEVPLKHSLENMPIKTI